MFQTDRINARVEILNKKIDEVFHRDYYTDTVKF